MRSLSGGQQQRLCIARSLAVNPQILLMDEPCSALDPTSTNRVEQTIAEISSDVTVVIVTHNMQQAARVSQQCAFFLASQGTPGKISRGRPDGGDLRQPEGPADVRLRERALRVTPARRRPAARPVRSDRHLPIEDRPRRIKPSKAPSDVIFRGGVRSVAIFVLVVTGGIAVFLGYQLNPTLHHYGSKFFTGSTYNPEFNKIGIAGALVGTAEVALVAVGVGFPLALLTALYISEYAPAWLRPTLVSVIDLMAAVPSIIFGLWGLLALAAAGEVRLAVDQPAPRLDPDLQGEHRPERGRLGSVALRRLGLHRRPVRRR